MDETKAGREAGVLVECACGAMVPAKSAGDTYCLQPIAGTDVLCSESKPCPAHKET